MSPLVAECGVKAGEAGLELEMNIRGAQLSNNDAIDRENYPRTTQLCLVDSDIWLALKQYQRKIGVRKRPSHLLSTQQWPAASMHDSKLTRIKQNYRIEISMCGMGCVFHLSNLERRR